MEEHYLEKSRLSEVIEEAAVPLSSLLRRSDTLADIALRLRFCPQKLGFSSPKTTMMDYERIISMAQERNCFEREGDIVEIGAFLGGGTSELAKVAEENGKKVTVIDVFQPGFDDTESLLGISMSSLYQEMLKQFDGRGQREVFDEVTSGFDNIEVIEKDSKKAEVSSEKICFGFVDGHHSSEYVENDFHLLWNKLVSGGMIGVDDYGFDLPDVTSTVDDLVDRYEDEIEEFVVDEKSHIAFIRKA
ncbi:MAG: class I SAM-dependent methyltransferase [Candidatus Nanosalina sp.]